jgi:small-conductance mechanosensitive channel
MHPETESRPDQNENSQAELEALGRERLKELDEAAPEAAAENQAERAEQARETLANHEVAPTEPMARADQETPTSTLADTLDRVLNYRQTMASLQRRLSPASRNFSKVIHNQAVESTSEALEKTVMRPSVALGATWTALIVGLIFYLTARHYGYRLSGFEMIAALIVGGILGVILEGLSRFFRRKRG